MEIPAGLAGVTTFVFDVDGTLAGADHQVSQANLDALRRLDAQGVKLVIADDHKGLRAAARRVFNATHQRCCIHSMRKPSPVPRPSSAPPWRRC